MSDMDAMTRVRDLVYYGRGPVLVQARISSDPALRVLPIRDGHAIKLRFTDALSRLET